MKKALALILTLVMALCAAAPVLAADDDAQGEAGIVFRKKNPSIEEPDPPEWDDYVTDGLHFGIHNVSDVVAGDKFNSQEWAYRTEVNGTSSNPGKGEITGFVIDNGSYDGWYVTIEMGGFFIKDGDYAGDSTLDGYTLSLNYLKQHTNNPTGDAPAYYMDTTVELKASPSLGDYAALLVRADDDEGVGLWGYAYDGDLDVPANSMKPGEAQAVMYWEVTAGPVTP